VRDLAKINLFFAFGDARTAIVNAGTSKSRSFNDQGSALEEPDSVSSGGPGQ
jgi:hypothetical protein